MGIPENQSVATSAQLSSSQLQCLQHMGITLWQRRGVGETGAESDTGVKSEADVQPESGLEAQLVEAQPQEAESPAARLAATQLRPDVATQEPEIAVRRNNLLAMQVSKVAADTAVMQTNVVIVRVALSAAVAEPLDSNEYQLLLKMMASINLAANQWICANEASGDQLGSAPQELEQLLDTANAGVLLLLLPASELAGWEQHWVDFESEERQPLSVSVQKKISVAGRSLTVAPLCDPRDLLLDGALKRDAWECLKQVRSTLSRQSGQLTCG